MYISTLTGTIIIPVSLFDGEYGAIFAIIAGVIVALIILNCCCSLCCASETSESSHPTDEETGEIPLYAVKEGRLISEKEVVNSEGERVKIYVLTDVAMN